MTLSACVEDIGRRSFPESAAELVGELNLSLRFAQYPARRGLRLRRWSD